METIRKILEKRFGFAFNDDAIDAAAKEIFESLQGKVYTEQGFIDPFNKD